MAYTPHQLAAKANDNAAAMVTELSNNLVIANSFTRFNAEDYLGRAGDKITYRVPGTLPFRTWDFRNDRREPLRVDTLTETTVDMTVSAKWIYSAVEMTPEQKQFNFGGDWGDLFLRQQEALVRGVEHTAFSQIQTAPYELIHNIDVDPAKIEAQAKIGRDYLFNQFLDLKTALKRMRVPSDSFVILAGSNFLAEMQKSGKLLDAHIEGRSAFATATAGTYAGFQVVEGPYVMDPNEAYIYSKDAFLFWNAAPPVADGAIAQGVASVNGVSLKWFQDYDPAYALNRSIYMGWQSWNITKDFLSLEAETGQSYTSPDQYFIRGIKLLLTAGATSGATGGASTMFGGTDIPSIADVKSQLRYPGDGHKETPGGVKDSFLAKAFRGELADGKVPTGLFMPPHLREGAETQNPSPVKDPAPASGVPVVTPGK